MALQLTQIGPTQTLTVSTTALRLTDSAIMRSATHLLAYSSDKIRWLAGGGAAPTSTSGMFIAAGGYLDWTEQPAVDYGQMIRQLQMIKDTGAAGDSTVEVMFFKAVDR